jgi:hypothetical protein
MAHANTRIRGRRGRSGRRGRRRSGRGRRCWGGRRGRRWSRRGRRAENKQQTHSRVEPSRSARMATRLGDGDGVGEGVGEASNTMDDPVPIIAATKIRRPSTWPATLDVLVQVAEVAEVQLVVEQEALASEREAEGSEIPNCKPEMVSCAPPDSGAFTLRDEDTTGAAREDQCIRFPIWATVHGMDSRPWPTHRRS